MTEKNALDLLKLKNVTLKLSVDGQEHFILDSLSLTIPKGCHLGIAGESGAGKSMLINVLTALLPEKKATISGQVLFLNPDGSYTDLYSLPASKRYRYCANRISLIQQDSINALNPFETVQKQWYDTIHLHNPALSRDQANAHMLEQLDYFRLSGGMQVLKKYPHQLSGGMKQRIAIAMALESNAPFLIADEPTTSLDSVNQKKIIELIDRICSERHLTLLYVSHNLALIQRICSRAAILLDGRIIEDGTTDTVFHTPSQPYTRQLIDGTKALYTF